MNRIKLVALSSIIAFGLGCGEEEKGIKKLKINTENLSEKAKELAEEAAQKTEENIAILEEKAEASKENIEKKTEELKDALKAMDKEFETNE
ncbi:MAG: hypothetical protein JKY53_04530 [Flavobacteriales bacterium]|nr:hypothetical protein [Flavobacteriales bacterium]